MVYVWTVFVLLMKFLPRLKRIDMFKSTSLSILIAVFVIGFLFPSQAFACYSCPPPEYCELQLTKVDNVDPVNPGNELIYSLTLENVGTADCTGTGVRVKDVFDENTEYVSSSKTPETITSEYIKWNFGTLNPGEVENLDLTMLVSEEAECDSVLVNKVKFWSNQTDWGDYVIEETTVECPPEPYCGDGNLDQGEECEIGHECMCEQGYVCNTETCLCEEEVPEPVCGNDILEDGEECDDGNTEDGDGCSSTCTIEPQEPEINPGDIVINEIIQNPDAVSDTNGEWFEVYNTTSNSIDLMDCLIGDEGSDSHTISSSLIVPAESYAVLGRNGSASENGGFIPDYVYSNFVLANTSDEIILTCGITEIDRVEYDDGATFPNPTGASMILDDPFLDNNVGSNWCVSVSPFGDGDLGTPGSQNDSCEQAGPVCGNEILEEGEECEVGYECDCGFVCNEETCLCEEEPVEPVCGNDILEQGEECDDGNTEDGDGCSSTCTIEQVPVCDPEIELATNGSFETPIVTAGQGWDIFNSSEVPGWYVEWMSLTPSMYNSYPRPANALLELQRSFNSWDPYEGDQYAELDTDWDGPSGSLSGEPASAKIYQDISTIPGETYDITFYFSPRPNTTLENNRLELSWDGGVVDNTIDGAGENTTTWFKHEYSLAATGETTRLQFADIGLPSDSLGTFLDNVSVRCNPEPGPEPYCGDGNLDQGEECDDGNNDNGDGCSSTCAIEPEPPTCLDADQDGYYAYDEVYCSEGDDCDDSNPDVNPGADEICDNQIDDDCDGYMDCEDEDCSEDLGCACITSGGTIGTSMCCLATGDFPDTCSVGACACAPEESHEVKVCNCGEGRCFDGSTCVDIIIPECTSGETQSCNTGQSGICSSGTQTCGLDGFWGQCVQNNEPTGEICGNGLDDDCDGDVDEGCSAVVNGGGGGGGGQDRPHTCGDGRLSPFGTEECDDGNNDNGDGCSSKCKIEGIGGEEEGEVAGEVTEPEASPPTPTPPSAPGPAPVPEKGEEIGAGVAVIEEEEEIVEETLPECPECPECLPCEVSPGLLAGMFGIIGKGCYDCLPWWLILLFALYALIKSIIDWTKKKSLRTITWLIWFAILLILAILFYFLNYHCVVIWIWLILGLITLFIWVFTTDRKKRALIFLLGLLVLIIILIVWLLNKCLPLWLLIVLLAAYFIVAIIISGRKKKKEKAEPSQEPFEPVVKPEDIF
jgi:uncharacterized repeat protein (TIGR01451 family)